MAVRAEVAAPAGSGAALARGGVGGGAGQGRLTVVAAFATIYVVWGSTYLAIAYAVETLPPFLMMATRMLVAGGVLYGSARWRGAAGLSRAEWQAAAVTGTMLFLGGYGALAWAEQRIASGTAALLGTTSPLWLVVLQWGSGGRRPGMRTWAGLALGMAGVGLLLWDGAAGLRTQLLPAAAVLGAAFFWAAGSLRASRSPLGGSAARSAGAEMLAGGAVVLVAGLVLGEGRSLGATHFTASSLLALGYLTVFGSVAAFSAYRWLLSRTSPSLVSTHSYVNPAVALVLGWLLADEPLGWGVLLSGAAIVGAVALLRAGRSDAGTAGETSADTSGAASREGRAREGVARAARGSGVGGEPAAA